jgi:hypothetical protein
MKQKRSTFKILTVLSLAFTAALLVVGLAAADVIDSGFETGAFAPNWATAFGLHNAPLAGSPPFTGADVPVAAAGGAYLSAVLGPFAPMSQADALAPALLYPAYGSYSARLNDSSTNYHQNWITQTFTIDASNLDSVDGLYHLRMVYAPVLDSAGHVAQDQPFFWVRVTNNTTGGTILYDDVFVPGDPGIPWQSSGSWRWLDWALIDVSAGLSNGDNVTVQITAADCDAGGHGGYAYVDAIGGSIPGPIVTATGPATTGRDVDITYTVNYKNGDSIAANSVVVTLNAPSNTTGTGSTSGDGGACSGTGPITCNFGTLAAGASGTFTTTWHTTSPVGAATVTFGNYNIAGTSYPTLTGPAVLSAIPAIPAPTITSIVPNSGPVAGGTTVVITGTDLTGGTVTFGGTAATCTVDSATQITCTTPAHAPGAVDVVVTTPGGTATSTGGFTYVPLPTVAGISPRLGVVAGGTSVTITGTGFTGATFTFGGVAASCTVTSDTSATCATPAGAAGGAVDVVATTPVGGTGTTTSPFYYVALNPIIGPTAGGQTVTITGVGFTGATVYFNGLYSARAACTATTDFLLTCITPARPVGPTDVVIATLADGNVFLLDGYTYAPAPSIDCCGKDGCSPNTGSPLGGETVLINGENLTGGTFTFGGVPAVCTVNPEGTQASCITPAHAPGLVDVVVTTVGGTATVGFTYGPYMYYFPFIGNW